MAGINISFYFFSADKRQKCMHIKKEHPYNILLKDWKSWSMYFSLDMFLPSNNIVKGNRRVSFLKSNSVNSVNTIELKLLSIKDQIYRHLMLYTNLSSLFYLNDATYYKDTYISSFSCYLSYSKLNFFISINTLNLPVTTIYSSSYIIPSFSWVERELREFFNIYYIGLCDTRKLLTDYTELSYNTESYLTASYDLILQDLYK